MLSRLAFVLLVLLTLAQNSYAQIKIASGKEDGNYYKLANSIKRLLKESNISKDVAVVKTNGSTDNLNLLHSKKVELAIVQSDTAFYARNGLNSFKEEYSNLFTVINLFTEPIFILTNQRDINSIKQLEFKKVNIGAVGSGLAESANVIINASKVENVFKIQGTNNFAKTMLLSNEIQAMFTNSISKDLKELIKEHKLFIVPISKRTIDNLNSTYRSYFPYVYKIDRYKSVNTIATTAILATNNLLPEDKIYTIATTLDKNYDKLEIPKSGKLKKRFAVNPLDKWSEGTVSYANREHILLKSNDSSNLYILYGIVAAVLIVLIIFSLTIYILRQASFLHRYKFSNSVVNFMQKCYEYFLEHKYSFLTSVIAILYLIIALLIKYFEHSWAINNHTSSTFDQIGILDNLSWLFVFGSSGYNGDIFPNSEGGKLVASMVPIVGIGGMVAYIGLITFDQVKKYFLEVNTMVSKQVKNHIIICGWNDNTRYIVENLLHKNITTKRQIVILADEVHEEEIKECKFDPIRVFYIKGKATNRDDLAKTNILHAEIAIVVSDKTYKEDPDARVILKALTLRKVDDELKRRAPLHIIAEIFEPKNIPLAEDAGADQIVSLGNIESKIFTQSIQNPGVTKFINEIMTYNDDNDIYSFSIDKKSTLLGKTYDEILVALRKYNILLLSINLEHRRSREEINQLLEKFSLEKAVITNPITDSQKSYKTEVGDLIIVLAQYEDSVIKALKQLNGGL